MILGLVTWYLGTLIIYIVVSPFFPPLETQIIRNGDMEIIQGGKAIAAAISMAAGVLIWLSLREFINKVDRKPEALNMTTQSSPPETTSLQPRLEEAQGVGSCPKCGSSVAGQASFCTSCGTDLKLKICLNCDTENPAEATFCMSCAKELSTT